MLGGSGANGNAEHRYLAQQFLDRFGDKVSRIICADPPARPIHKRLQRLIKRGNFVERIARARYPGSYGPDAEHLRRLLLPDEQTPQMPGGDKVHVVASHNSEQCQQLIAEVNPAVIVVYGTAIIHEPTFSLAKLITLNMHTGLSPFYRGDSTLFWPVYFDDPEHLGVTVHELVASVDGGDVASTARIQYEQGDTEAHLFCKGVKAGATLYLDAVEQALNGTLRCQPQDLSMGKEFSWRHRTVAAEHQVMAQLERWAAQ